MMLDRVKELCDAVIVTPEELERLKETELGNNTIQPELVQLYAADLIAQGLFAISRSIDELAEQVKIADL